MKEIFNVKKNKEDFEKATKNLESDIKKQPMQKGLMAAPQPENEEMI